MSNNHTISVLKPNVSQREALRCFSATGLASVYWRLRSGPLRRIADAYVPYSLFTVRFRTNNHVARRSFAMDAVNGSLDLFQFSRAPEPHQLVSISTRNTISPSLLDAFAEELLRQKVLRLIFQQGFFKVRDPKLEIRREHPLIYIPYWLGFYGNTVARCRALDAVRRRFEGAKASAFFEQWLAA